MKRFFFLGSASAVAILAACSSPTSTASSDACSKYFDTLAQTTTRCGSASSSFDPADKTNFVAFCQATVAAPGSGVTDSYLNTCNGALAATTSCNISQVAGCENPSGKLANGAACYSGAQCVSGECSKTGGVSTDGGIADAGAATGISCGTCDPRAAENAACDASGVTAPRCMSALTCTNGTCVKPVTIPSGGACSYTGPPGTNCAAPTTCIPGSNGAGTCGAPPKKGEKCSFICDTNLTCTAGTCQDKVALGGACPTGTECQSTLYCDSASKLCAALKAGKSGDPCATGVKCDPGLSCRAVGDSALTCMPLKNKGEACIASANECAMYLDCIGGTCQTPDPSQCK